MFPNQQPANVGKEEATPSIVRVCIGLWELVVDAVISSPLNDIILKLKENSKFIGNKIPNTNIHTSKSVCPENQTKALGTAIVIMFSFSIPQIPGGVFTHAIYMNYLNVIYICLPFLKE